MTNYYNMNMEQLLFPWIEYTELSNLINVCKDNNYIYLNISDNIPSELMQYANSDDKNILCSKKHLTFQVSENENINFSYFNSSKYHYSLNKRYLRFFSEYLSDIFKEMLAERTYLDNMFSDININIKIRIKSPTSYKTKLDTRIKNGECIWIDDIVGTRIIVSPKNENQNEDFLVQKCFEIADSLISFRKINNFELKEPIKNFFTHGQNNEYKSIHIKSVQKLNSDFSFETQIRTLKLEQFIENNPLHGHSIYKPRLLNEFSEKKLPVYYYIANNKQSNPYPVKVSDRKAFYHLFHVPIDKYHDELKYVYPAIQLIRNKSIED